MKNIIYLTLLVAFSFSAYSEEKSERNEFTPLALELSWYDAAGSKTGGMRIEGIEDKGFYRFSTPIPLVDIATHYIRYFTNDGWVKLGDYPKIRMTNEQWDWGGVYGKGDLLIWISCHGSWDYGAFTTDGKVDSYSSNSIYIQVLKGEPMEAFGGDPTEKAQNAEALERYLKEWAERDPNSKVRFDKDQVTGLTGHLAYQAYLEDFERKMIWSKMTRDNHESNDPFGSPANANDQP